MRLKDAVLQLTSYQALTVQDFLHMWPVEFLPHIL